MMLMDQYRIFLNFLELHKVISLDMNICVFRNQLTYKGYTFYNTSNLNIVPWLF